MEVLYQEIFSKIKCKNYELGQYLSIDKYYLSLRNKILDILYKISIELGFKRQTYFLSAYFLDNILSNNKKRKQNIYKLGLACLCLSAKVCENDPKVPHLKYFAKTYNNKINNKNIISINDLYENEILACKLLDYKLNHYTIYDYNIFFFSNGLLKIEQLNNLQIYNGINSHIVQKILNEIYKKSNLYLNNVFKLCELCLKYNPLFISLLIMNQSLKIVLKNELNIKNEEEFHKKIDSYFKKNMNDFYQIDYESNEQYKQLINEPEIQKIFFENDNYINNNINEDEIQNINMKKEKITIKKRNFSLSKEKSIILNKKIPINGFYKKINSKDNFNDINTDRVDKNNNILRSGLLKNFQNSSRGKKSKFPVKKHNNSINILKNSYDLNYRKIIPINYYKNDIINNSKNKKKNFNLNDNNDIANNKLNDNQFILRNENNKTYFKRKICNIQESLFNTKTFLNSSETNLNNNLSINKENNSSFLFNNENKKNKNKIDNKSCDMIKIRDNESKRKNNSKKKEAYNLNIKILKPKNNHKIFESSNCIKMPNDKIYINNNNHQNMRKIEYKNKDKISEIKINENKKQKESFEYLLSQKEKEINKTFKETNKGRRNNNFLDKINKSNFENTLNNKQITKSKGNKKDIIKPKSNKKEYMNKTNYNYDSQNKSTIIINNKININIYKNKKMNNIPKLNISNININSNKYNNLTSSSSTKRNINKIENNTGL